MNLLHKAASTLLTRTVPGEEQVTIASGKVTLAARRSLPHNLANHSPVSGNTSVKLPDLANFTGNSTFVDGQVRNSSCLLGGGAVGGGKGEGGEGEDEGGGRMRDGGWRRGGGERKRARRSGKGVGEEQGRRRRGEDYSLSRQISHVTPNRLVYLCIARARCVSPTEISGTFWPFSTG